MDGNSGNPEDQAEFGRGQFRFPSNPGVTGDNCDFEQQAKIGDGVAC
jgi:hypothetical protein